jgi:hypothetical protein
MIGYQVIENSPGIKFKIPFAPRDSIFRELGVSLAHELQTSL